MSCATFLSPHVHFVCSSPNPRVTQTWETRYLLLLWLSIIVIIPFDLSRMDGVVHAGAPRQRIVDRILEVGKLYLSVADKSRDAAALLLAK